MKKNITFTILAVLLAFMGCQKLDDVNINPNAPTPESLENMASLVTHVQRHAFVEDRFNTWRGNLIFGTRFAEQFSFGFAGTWFGDGAGFNYNQAWTDAAWDAPMERVSATLQHLLELTETGGNLEDQGAHAVALIMKGFFYQRMSDQFGAIPFSEAGLGIPFPKYDDQEAVYNEILADLQTAIQLLEGVSESNILAIADGDVVFGGDKDKWLKAGNTLRLRMALRAREASNGGTQAAIDAALQKPFLSGNGETFQIFRDPTNGDAVFNGYYDIWWTFAGCCGNAAQWVVSETMVDFLKGNTDPRLFAFAMPVEGGTVGNPDDYVGGKVAAKVEFTQNVPFSSLSKPREEIWNDRAFPFITMTWAEAELLQAEAFALKSDLGNAQTHFEQAIRANMEFWGVEEADILAYLGTPAAQLNAGTAIEQIGQERWLAAYTNGYEAWSVMRRFDLSIYPDKSYDADNEWALTSAGVNNAMAKRLRYATASRELNSDNVQDAVSRQGADEMTTSVWWDVR